jgi:hypothetical protein
MRNIWVRGRPTKCRKCSDDTVGVGRHPTQHTHTNAEDDDLLIPPPFNGDSKSGGCDTKMYSIAVATERIGVQPGVLPPVSYLDMHNWRR